MGLAVNVAFMSVCPSGKNEVVVGKQRKSRVCKTGQSMVWFFLCVAWSLSAFTA